ncbi:MAG: DeoR family transcriptional regulator [Chloroflexi bacterium]|nr:DeoR family transcriptional regulator [Chloroflexota bacterium]
MTNTPAERREKILGWLKDENLMRIDVLAERLRVSAMTVHRDVIALAEEGLVERVHGGVQRPSSNSVMLEVCSLCQMPVRPRLQFSLTTKANEQLRTCCAHCGLLLLAGRDDIETALLREFIYGRMINALQAYFVIGSRISLCCEPSVLAFSSQEDAADFQRGFGGRVLDFWEASQHLSDTHSVHRNS